MHQTILFAKIWFSYNSKMHKICQCSSSTLIFLLIQQTLPHVIYGMSYEINIAII